MSIAESFGEGMRLGLSITRLQGEREERKEREVKRKEDLKFRTAQEARDVKLGARQEKAFEWKTEDREKKKRYDIALSEYAAAKAHRKAGNERLALAKYADVYNKHIPDRGQVLGVFRDDKPDAESIAKWDSFPKLKGKKIGIMSEKVGDAVGFNSMEEVEEWIEAGLTPGYFLKVSKESEEAVSKLNLQAKPFQDKNGVWWVHTFVTGPDGNAKRGPDIQLELYGEKVPTTKQEQIRLGTKTIEKDVGPLSREQKLSRYGIKPPKKEKAVAPGKKLDQYKKSLNLVLQLFSGKSKESMYDPETGELTESGNNALDSALKLVEKADSDPNSLTAVEKKKLPHARRAWEMYGKISEAVSAEYEPKEDDGMDWRSYPRQYNETTPTDRQQLGGPPLERQSVNPIPPSY